MKPLFFGDPDAPLFGTYHPPDGANATGEPHAVLLCYPGVHEYNMSHWAFRRLAIVLARRGLHVLRFDYFGTGDSAGQGVEGGPERWTADIQTAADELKDLAHVQSLSIVGMRLGATLASRACARGLAARRVVLWDPVISGGEHLKELERWDWHRALLLLHAWRARGVRRELLGFALGPGFRTAVADLRIDAPALSGADAVDIVVTDERRSYRDLHDALLSAGVRVNFELAPDGSNLQRGPVEHALLPRGSIDAVARALSDSQRGGE